MLTQVNSVDLSQLDKSGMFSDIHVLDPFGAPSLRSRDQICNPAYLSNAGSHQTIRTNK